MIAHAHEGTMKIGSPPHWLHMVIGGHVPPLLGGWGETQPLTGLFKPKSEVAGVI